MVELTLKDIAALLRGEPLEVHGLRVGLVSTDQPPCADCDRPEICRTVIPGSQPCRRFCWAREEK